jgi:multidrug resistance efflux pump
LEILVTIAYLAAIWLVFYDYKWLRMNLVWGLVLAGLYCAAVVTEIVLLGQFTPYSKTAFVQQYVIPIAPDRGGKIIQVFVKPGTAVKKGAPLFKMESDSFSNKVDELSADLVLAKQNIKELGALLDAAAANVTHENEKLKVAATEVELLEAVLSAAREKEKLDRIESDAQKQLVAKGAATARRAERALQNLRISQDKVIEAEKNVTEAKQKANDRSVLLGAKANYAKAELSLSAMIDGEHASVRKVEAQLKTAEINLEQRTVYAPSDGHVINLQLQPGTVVRLKVPIVAFVSSLDQWIVVKIRQKGAQYVQAGDEGEVAFEMYPGKVFPANVERIIFGSGDAQLTATGLLPKEEQVKPGEHFFVIMRVDAKNMTFPLHFGARGIASIYTKAAPDALKIIRKLEIRSESYLNYLYNPF